MSLARAVARGLFGADLGQLMLDAHADRRAGVEGLEATDELIRAPFQFARGFRFR